MKTWTFLWGCLLFVCLNGAVCARAQGTSFNYQGRLNDNGAPASGSYDLQFTVYGSATEGTPLPGIFATNGVAVSNGLFTVMLDFGASVFTGAQRWLEVEVKTNGGAGPPARLAPRQAVGPAPYALFATQSAQANAAPWGGLSGVNVGAGLSLGASNGIAVRFGNTAATAAAGDHNHFFQEWSGVAGGTSGLKINNSGSGGVGVFGSATATTGSSFGLRGDSDSSAGIGVFGRAGASSGNTFGVQGVALSPGGAGLGGFHQASIGTEPGVRGQTDSTTDSASGVVGVVNSSAAGSGSAGVRGVNNGTSNGIGVQGDSAAVNGNGVLGRHTSTSGTAAGVHGETASTSGSAAGVLGQVTAVSAGGFSAGVRGINQSTTGSGIGVYGSQNGNGWGVYGTSPHGAGIYGSSTDGSGVAASSSTGPALNLTGSGIIQSSAETEISIPGLAAVTGSELHKIPSTWGGASFSKPDANAVSFGYIYFPVTIPNTLYGQRIRLKSLTTYYLCRNGAACWIESTGVTGSTNGISGEYLLIDTTPRTSDVPSSYTLNFPPNTLISPTNAIIAVIVDIKIDDNINWVSIGGFRLRIGHD